eukprot:m.20421 g.20421  ORF g.20421 m.20421 type:complete len:748 (-) comp3789_c0_seq1:1612-3855(-)
MMGTVRGTDLLHVLEWDELLILPLLFKAASEHDARTSTYTPELVGALWEACWSLSAGSDDDSDDDSDDENDERVAVGPYGPRNPRFQRATNQDLIRQCLLEFPQALTGEHEMLAHDELDARAEESDEAWLDIMTDLTRVLPMANPLSAALMAVMVDDLPTPSQETFDQLVPRVLEVARGTDSTAIQRNVLILIGSFAERYAGPVSERMMTDELLHFLLEYVPGPNSALALSAILALEKLAQTRRNKERALEAGVASMLHDLEKNHFPVEPAAASGSTDYYNEIWRAQVGFCAMWALDNVFPAEGRQFTMDRVDMTDVNVMLDPRDATKHLKLAADGLEARNDFNSFESVKSTCSARGGGFWYYEATVLTSGIMQIGWATDRCAYQSEDGIGIGDDVHSYAYDGCRGLLWHGPRHYAHGQRWKPGDVLGSLLDLNRGLIYFSLNGHVLPKMLRVSPSAMGENFYPAASLMSYQHVLFNFGNQPYQHLPKFEGSATPEIQSLNAMGNMTAEQKRIVPRLVVLEQLRKEREEEDDCARCQICFDEPPNCVVEPCNHSDFCSECASKCDRCPLCRVVITAVSPLVKDPAGPAVATTSGGADGVGTRAIPAGMPITDNDYDDDNGDGDDDDWEEEPADGFDDADNSADVAASGRRHGGAGGAPGSSLRQQPAPARHALNPPYASSGPTTQGDGGRGGDGGRSVDGWETQEEEEEEEQLDGFGDETLYEDCNDGDPDGNDDGEAEDDEPLLSA